MVLRIKTLLLGVKKREERTRDDSFGAVFHRELVIETYTWTFVKNLGIISIMDILENELLSQHTTFKVGGPARYFCIAQTVDELKHALDFAKEKNIDFFILAGGSNLIVSDNGFSGLVIKTEFRNCKIDDDKIIVGSGCMIDKLVDIASEKGLKGLEWAGGLPGTIGGAVRGNAGAFGGEIKDCVLQVKSLSSYQVHQVIDRNNQDCQFGYRTSIFKRNEEIILEVELQMRRGDPDELKKIADEHRQYRREKHPIEYGCAGSIFKNIPTDQHTYEVVQRFKDVVKTDPFPVIPTAAIIAAAGLKGYTIGGAQVSEKHPNYIINLGNATAQDIIAIVEYEVKAIKEKYSISLEVEPQLLGFNSKFDWESK